MAAIQKEKEHVGAGDSVVVVDFCCCCGGVGSGGGIDSGGNSCDYEKNTKQRSSCIIIKFKLSSINIHFRSEEREYKKRIQISTRL